MDKSACPNFTIKQIRQGNKYQWSDSLAYLSMYDSDYHNFPTDFISFLQWVKAKDKYQTEFLLQLWNQWEDSAILLDSNRTQQQWPDKETKNDRKEKEKLKERTNRERLGTLKDKLTIWETKKTLELQSLKNL